METDVSQSIPLATLRRPAIEYEAPTTRGHESIDDLIEFHDCHAASHSKVECLATRAVKDDGQLFALHRILDRYQGGSRPRLRKRRGLADEHEGTVFFAHHKPAQEWHIRIADVSPAILPITLREKGDPKWKQLDQCYDEAEGHLLPLG